MNAEITPTAPDGALRGSMRDFRELAGVDLLDRVRPFFDWQQLRQAHGLWPYSKATDAAPQPVCSAKDEAGREFGGVNFASQDYLGLASHPEVKSAAREAIEAYGVHSAGSSALAGNTRYSVQLEHAIAEFVRLDHVTLYPTGWAAGYGVMRGLVREGRLVRLRCELPDVPGALSRLSGVIGKHAGNIVEVHHQRLFHDTSVKRAELDVVVETQNRRHVEVLIAALVAAGFPTQLLLSSADDRHAANNR